MAKPIVVKSNTVRALKRQGYKCGECSLAFLPEDKVELHHIDGNHHNWKTKNLVDYLRSPLKETLESQLVPAFLFFCLLTNT